MVDPAEELFCHLEGTRFPRGEFKDTVEHGVVHERGRLHTIDGTFVTAETLPGPDAAPPPSAWDEDGKMPPPPAAPF